LIRDYTGLPPLEETTKEDALVKASHRATTSSRMPGRVNRGTVWTEAGRLVTCPDCGAAIPERIPTGRHAPRRVEGRLVNCAGKEMPS
jgi:hypothetical protein